jgi:transposase
LHLIGLDEQGIIVLREKLARGRIGGRLANVPSCLIGIEAGMGMHYVARELISLGHDVRQVPPAYAKPFRQTHKNDFRDAYAIAEAVRRPSTRCVPVKTDDQLDLQAAVSLAIVSEAEHTIAAGLLAAYLGSDAGCRVHAGVVEHGSVESIRAVLWYARSYFRVMVRWSC